MALTKLYTAGKGGIEATSAADIFGGPIKEKQGSKNDLRKEFQAAYKKRVSAHSIKRGQVCGNA